MRMRLLGFAATAALMAALFISPALVERSAAAPAVISLQSVNLHSSFVASIGDLVEVRQHRQAVARNDNPPVLDRTVRAARSGQAIKPTAKAGWGSGRLRTLSDG